MSSLKQLLKNNQYWAESLEANNPGIFATLAKQQSPDYLWIGCSDSRVPANDIVGLLPGELFVHRNVANVVSPMDINCLSVLQYAVEALGVKDIIVCGHYGCGGIKEALTGQEHGLIDSWLSSIKDIYHRNRKRFQAMTVENNEVDTLCELNVIQQVKNVCNTAVVQHAWSDGKKLAVHGLIYSIEDGLLKDLNVTSSSAQCVDAIYQYIEK